MGMGVAVVFEFALHRIPGLRIDDGGMLAFVVSPLVGDLTDVMVVLEEGVERPARDGLSAGLVARGADAHLADDAGLIQMGLEYADGAEFQVLLENGANCLGLFGIDHQGAVFGVVAEWHVPTHPQAFLLGGGNLVANALSRDFPLELGEGQQHIQGQPSHRGRGVELLGDGDEGGPAGIEALNHPGEVGEGAGQAVDFVDHDHLDLTGIDVVQEPGEGGALHGAAGIPPIIVVGRDELPAFVLLTLYEGFAGLALRIEGIEALVEALVGGLAGVDGAAQSRFHRRA